MKSPMMVHFYPKHFWLFIYMAVGPLSSLAEPDEANLDVDRGVRMDP